MSTNAEQMHLKVGRILTVVCHQNAQEGRTAIFCLAKLLMKKYYAHMSKRRVARGVFERYLAEKFCKGSEKGEGEEG